MGWPNLPEKYVRNIMTEFLWRADNFDILYPQYIRRKQAGINHILIRIGTRMTVGMYGTAPFRKWALNSTRTI